MKSIRTTPSRSGVRIKNVLCEGLDRRRGTMVAAEVLKWGFALHGLTARLLDVASVMAMVSHDVLSIFRGELLERSVGRAVRASTQASPHQGSAAPLLVCL